MILDWWHSLLALPIQERLIPIQPLRDEPALHRAIENPQNAAGLLSLPFLDLYLPSQPNLLFALLLLLIATILCLLLLFGAILRTRFSRFFETSSSSNSTSSSSSSSPQSTKVQKFGDEKSSAVASAAHCGQQQQQNEESSRRFRFLLFAPVPLWLLTLFGCVLFATTLVALLALQSSSSFSPFSSLPSSSSSFSSSTSFSAPSLSSNSSSPIDKTTTAEKTLQFQQIAAVSKQGEEELLELQRESFAGEGERSLLEEGDDGEQSELTAREQRDNEGAPEMEELGGGGGGRQTLKKFEVIREIGYQFHSLVSPVVLSGWMLFGLFFLLLLFLGTLLVSLLAILIGLNQRFHRYSPMEHLSSKRLNSRVKRVRRLLIGTGMTLLCVTPLTLVLGATLLVHAHGHSAVCVMEQKVRQETTIDAHVKASFSAEEQAEIVPEFLSDFSAERISLAEENCRRERAPLENAWSSCLFLALAAVPFGFCLIRLASGWECSEREGSVSLRAYVPGWLQNSALTPDSYSSIPELGSNSGRHPSSASASQCSFGTGTFVYKKY